MSDNDWTWDLTPKAQDDLTALSPQEQDRILDKFQYIETVPASEFYPRIEEAEDAIGDTDPATCCTSPVRLLVTRGCGATTLISMNRTSFRSSRPAKLLSRSTIEYAAGEGCIERTVVDEYEAPFHMVD